MWRAEIVLESCRIFGEAKIFLEPINFWRVKGFFGETKDFSGGAEKFFRELNDF